MNLGHNVSRLNACRVIWCDQPNNKLENICSCRKQLTLPEADVLRGDINSPNILVEISP